MNSIPLLLSLLVAANSGILASASGSKQTREEIFDDCKGVHCAEQVSFIQNQASLKSQIDVTKEKKSSDKAKAKAAAEPESVPEAPKAASTELTTATGAGLLAVAAVLIAAGLFVGGKVPEDKEAARNSAQFLAEFVGTFMLVFSVGCNVLVGDATWGVIAIACTFMVSIYALGGVSGGNFNPAVSVCLGISQMMALPKVVAYVLIQCAAGICAGVAYGFMLKKTFNLAPAEGFSYMQAGLAELFYTFLLTFVVLNTACSKKHAGKDQFYGLAIGFSVVAGGYSGGAISGGCFNPAVALGIDASSMSQGFGWCFHYWMFELIGCAVAALLFAVCRPGNTDGNVESLGAKLVGEFIGTFMLVLTVGLNVLAGSKAAVFSIAASLMCMIFALGSACGAHFNPAVTAAILLRGGGKIKVSEAIAYVVTQIVGGVAAGFAFSFMQNGKTVPLKPSDSFSQALVGETVFTFLLAYVVLSVATIKSPLSQYFGLAIGSCVTAGGLAIGSLSGGSLNPAVSAGLALTDGGASISNFLYYSAAEVSGGILAAAIFHHTHHREYEEIKQ